MPRRNYKIFDWKEGETITDRLKEVNHKTWIDVLAIAKNSDGGGRYILKITDKDNLDNSVCFEVVVNAEGRVTNFQACPDLSLYSDLNVGNSPYSEEVKRIIVHAMGNDLGETVYLVHLKHKRYIKKSFELEVTVSPTEKLSYIQEPPDCPLEIADEEDS